MPQKRGVTLRAVRIGNQVQVTAATDTAGPVYFFWFVDGSFVGRTAAAQRTFWIGRDEQARIEVFESVDPETAYTAFLPVALSAGRTLWWIRSFDDDVARYRVDENVDAGGYNAIASVRHEAGRFSYRFVTGRLTDLASYQWRVVPVDQVGNEGTPVELDAETIVRTPDAPSYTVAFDEGTDRVTFAES